jgi:hypothetical protein
MYRQIVSAMRGDFVKRPTCGVYTVVKYMYTEYKIHVRIRHPRVRGEISAFIAHIDTSYLESRKQNQGEYMFQWYTHIYTYAYIHM